MKKNRIVVDTNIVVSAFFGGNPKQVLSLVIEEKVDLLVSTEILFELNDVLRRRVRHPEKVLDILRILKKKSILIKPKEKFKAIKDDPTDDKFLDCAVAGKADYIVSGDKKHVLPLKSFHGIPILTPKEFLEHLNR